MTVNDNERSPVAELSPPGEKPTWFTYSTGDRPLEGYTIKRGIGCGGFGEVYYAVSDGGKEVALKQIQRHLDVELRGVSQCLNLKHANLVVLYDVKRSERGENWVIMEFVSGDNLADIIARHPSGMPENEVLSLLRGISDGVSYLHEHGIVHRDLKPGNIFIEDHQVKIGDYGLAKFISASRRSGQTESVGTVHYMAPELAHGRYGKEIDLYAVGVIIYEMLTGVVPFAGQSPGEILMKHLTAQPDLSRVPAPFQPVVARLLAKSPEARYPSFDAMLADLDDCLAGRPRSESSEAPVPPPVWTPEGIGAHDPQRPPWPRQPEPAGRRTSPLRFWIDDVHGGFSTAEGQISVSGDSLVFDFQVKPLGMLSTGLKETHIAMSDIESMNLREGWFTTKLLIRVNRPAALQHIPTSSIGQATLRVARSDREAAREFVAHVMKGRVAAEAERPVSLHAPTYDYAGRPRPFRADDPKRADRLLRYHDDRVWLGVCGGIAARIGIDPVPIRVFWILLTIFSGFFVFLFGYLAMAMIMSESPYPSPIGLGTGRIRRLVRSRQDRRWAGVCSGFANYFELDPVWIRVATALFTIITGFLPGLFFYLLFCWAIPVGEPLPRPVRQSREPSAFSAALKYLGRILVRLPVALLCGGGVGTITGASFQIMGGVWNDEVAAFAGVGAGLATAAAMLVVLCRGVGWPHSFWPAWTTLFAGGGIALMIVAMSLVLIPGRNNEVFAAFSASGCGLLTAAFVAFVLYSSLQRPLGWRWLFVVLMLGAGAGLATAGASVLLDVQDEIAALVSVGVGLLVAGSLAWLLIFGRWVERLRPGVAPAGASENAPGSGSNLLQTATWYGLNSTSRALAIGPSLFIAVLSLAWLGAYGAFWLHGTRRSLSEVWRVTIPPVVVDWEVARLGGHRAPVGALAFDAMGERLATGDERGTVKLWHLATNTETHSFNNDSSSIVDLVFSHDGSRLAVASANRKLSIIWDLETGEKSDYSFEHPGSVHCVAFSPSGDQLVTGSTDEVVRLIDARTGELIKKFFGCKQNVQSVAFIAGGRRIAAVGENESQIRIWDVQTGRQLRPIAAPTWIEAFIVNADGRLLAGREYSGMVYVWDTETGREVSRFSTACSGGETGTLAFGQNGSQLATFEWPEVLLREIPSGRVSCTFKGHDGRVRALALSPDGNLVVSAGDDSSIRVWEVPASLRRENASTPQTHFPARQFLRAKVGGFVE